MKKSFYILVAFAAIMTAMAGCSKKKGGGVAAFVPGQCFNGYTTVPGGLPGPYPGYNGYQWNNGQCIDTRTNTVAPITACQNVVNNYSFAPNCNYYGGMNFWNVPVTGAYNACSVYNTPYEQFYPVYYANLNLTVCAGYSTYNYLWTFGTPAYYPGYNNVLQGCIPGTTINGCRCNSFGGTLGWFHGGVTLGICY